MKNFTFLLLFCLVIFTCRINAQDPCSVDNVMFSEAQHNPFGLFNNSSSATTFVFLLDVDNDNMDEAFVTDIFCIGNNCEGGVQSETLFFENIGDEEPEFVFDTLFENASAPFGWPDIPNVDIDNDGDLDIVRGFAFEIEPDSISNIVNLVFYENHGEPGGFDFTGSEPEVNPWGIELPVSPESGNPLVLIRPAFGDLDGDCDLDMFTGGFWPGLFDERYIYFENIGTPSEPQFGEPQFNPFGLEFLCCNHYSSLVDIDCDGDLDIFTVYGNGANSLYFHENTGSPTEPNFDCPPALWPDQDFNLPYGVFKDLHGDGKPDVFAGGDGVRYFENLTESLNCANLFPEAGFEYIQNDLAVSFTDTSSGEITQWHWDFGDGTTSEEQNPVHVYSEFDIYEVCLTVWQQCKTDKFCRFTEVVSDIKSPSLEATLSLFPNPGKDQITLELESIEPLQYVNIEIFNVAGKKVREWSSPSFRKTFKENISVEGFLPGVYIFKVYSKGKFITRRWVKMK